MHLTLQPHWEGASIHLSVCNWDLLRCLVPSPALCIVLSLLPVLDLLWNPYMVISFSNAFGTGNNFQQQPLLPKKRMERTPAGKLLIDTHKQEKKMPWIPFHWASLPAYSFCHFGAKFDLYTFYYICFFATPTQPCPAVSCPALSCPACIPSNRSLAIAPGCFFVVPCGANEFKCVRNWVIKISVNSACLPACLPSVPTRFLRGVQAKISLWISQHFYIFVYFNLWPSAVQFISTASANGVKMKHDRRVHSVDSAYPVESCDATQLYPTLRSVLSNRTAMQAGLQLLQQNA